MIEPFELPATLEADLETPQLIVDLDVVRGNVAAVLEWLGGEADRWRPHLKSTKSTFLWRELLRAGLKHFKCATALELEVLLRLASREGIAVDVLVALPHRGANQRRVGDLAAGFPEARVSLLVEDELAAQEAHPKLGLFVDLDVGMGRTGIGLEDLERQLRVARAAGERLAGVHAYEGHEDGTGPDRDGRLGEVYRRLAARLDEWRAAGQSVGELVTSGTPGFQAAASFAPFRDGADGTRHRVSPGTVVLGDLRSLAQCPAVGLTPAARVLARVVSRPGRDRVTLDVGSKALAAEVSAPIAEVAGRPAWTVRAPSEEHLPVETGPERPEPAELVQLVPRHVCPTVNLARRALVLERGRAPRFEPIEARGHGSLGFPGERDV